MRMTMSVGGSWLVPTSLEEVRVNVSQATTIVVWLGDGSVEDAQKHLNAIRLKAGFKGSVIVKDDGTPKARLVAFRAPSQPPDFLRRVAEEL